MSEVYDFAADPLNLPRWAAGLAGSKVERDGHLWFTESPMGRVTFAFASRNDFGVLDHDVTLSSGQTVHNPLRVISDGDRCEVVFTLRQRHEMTDEDFARDADAVAKDLATLKSVVEGTELHPTFRSSGVRRTDRVSLSSRVRVRALSRYAAGAGFRLPSPGPRRIGPHPFGCKVSGWFLGSQHV